MADVLMRKILLVGDKPSKKNKDPKVAFEGTQSHETIKKWLKVFGEDYEIRYQMINRVDPNFSSVLIRATTLGYKIVALGEEAAKALQKAGVYNFFKLPHPSGRNRKLNNKVYVAKVLDECKNWMED